MTRENGGLSIRGWGLKPARPHQHWIETDDPAVFSRAATGGVYGFKYDGLGLGTLAFNNMSGIGRGGTGVLKVDGREVARQTMEHLPRRNNAPKGERRDIAIERVA